MKTRIFLLLLIPIAFGAAVFSEVTFALKIDKELTKATLEKIDDYHECHRLDRNGAICQAALEEWLTTHPKDMFKAAKMTRLRMNAYGALPFFRRAFDTGPQDCNDSDLKLASYSAFDGLFAGSTQDVLLKDAQHLVFKKCFDSFKKDLSSKMAKADARFKTNVCAGVKEAKLAKSALSSELANACPY